MLLLPVIILKALLEHRMKYQMRTLGATYMSKEVYN